MAQTEEFMFQNVTYTDQLYMKLWPDPFPKEKVTSIDQSELTFPS